VAGLTTGQDYSERALQLTGPAPQFSLAGLVTDLDPAVPGPISPFGRPLLREWLFTT
jgi:2,4-didehydro-3-deoxy-L-rhamnonate hydrolase